MIAKSKEVIATSYAVALRDGTVLDIDARGDISVELYQTLYTVIGKIKGVRDTDYDGHFGNYMYIEIDIKYDTEDTWKLIYDSINNYI